MDVPQLTQLKVTNKKGLQAFLITCKPFWLLYGGGNGFQLLNSDGGLFNTGVFQRSPECDSISYLNCAIKEDVVLL